MTLRKSLYLPIRKVDTVTTQNGGEALIVEGICSVAGILDSQADCMTEAALRQAMTEWADYANIRLQHDPSKPVGTAKMPPVGKLAAGIEPPGWRMDVDPRTGQPCAVLRIYIADPAGVAAVRNGVMRGLSVGGAVLEARDGWGEVDALGRVLSFQESA